MLVDDSGDFLASAARLLASEGLEVVGCASSGEEALCLLGVLEPELVMVDIVLGDEDGVDLARKLTERFPSTPVILMSSYELSDVLDLVAYAPAKGFLFKGDLSGSVIRHLRG